jgi:E3 ubiquitin-protein ligase synoviolin
MNDIVNQMRNPQAQNNQAAAQPAAQQGPNHLGLQDPYLPQAQGGLPNIPVTGLPIMQAARAPVPTQVQLMQIEQRILQDAQNLQLEQQQVALLRVMEAEMARLRAQYVPAQQNAAAGFGIQHQVPFAPSQEHLRAAADRVMSNGHANLPQGMVLPEGWTLMPLQRQEGTAPTSTQTAPTSQTTAPEPSTSATPARLDVEQRPNGTPEPQQTAQAPPTAPAESAAGPTDERGSPLFVPTAPAQTTPAAPTQPEIQSPTPTRTQHQDTTVTSPSAAPANAPWNSGSWGFGDQPASSEPAQPTAESNGEEQSQPENAEGYAGKGKGKAVEVEDAPDQDA